MAEQSAAWTTTALGDRLGMTVLSASAAETVVTMPVAGNTQIVGVLHGGATAALCETAASVAASCHAQAVAAGTPDMSLTAVGTEISVSHLRAAREGIVTATAVAQHLGRRRTVHTVHVRDERGRLISTALASSMIVEL